MKNEYANITEKINCANAHCLITKMSDNTKEMLLYKTRLRILNEISALEDNFWNATEFNAKINPIPFDKQMVLIQELFEYGFIEETKTCLNIMEMRINEMFQELSAWFRLQKSGFGFTVSGPKKGKKREKIFIEIYNISQNNIIEVTYCYAASLQILDSIKWYTAALTYSDLVYYMEKNGYNFLFEDMPNPLTGEHFQKEVKNNLAVYLQENLDKIIKEYIEEGYEVIEL